MTDIFVVTASKGEWSDRREWPVRAFTDEVAAQNYTTTTQAAARQAAQDFQIWDNQVYYATNATEKERLAKIAEIQKTLDFPGYTVDDCDGDNVSLTYKKIELV